MNQFFAFLFSLFSFSSSSAFGQLNVNEDSVDKALQKQQSVQTDSNCLNKLTPDTVIKKNVAPVPVYQNRVAEHASGLIAELKILKKIS